MRYRGPYSIEPIADHEAGAGSSRKRPGSFHRVLSRESRPGGAISPGLGIASLRMVSEPPRVRWRRVLCPQGLGVLLVCPIGEVGPGAIALVWSRVRTSSTVLELTPSIWLAVRGPWRSARVTRGYGSTCRMGRGQLITSAEFRGLRTSWASVATILSERVVYR